MVRALADISKKMLVESQNVDAERRPGVTDGKVRMPEDLEELAEMVLHGLPFEAIPSSYKRGLRALSPTSTGL